MLAKPSGGTAMFPASSLRTVLWVVLAATALLTLVFAATLRSSRASKVPVQSSTDVLEGHVRQLQTDLVAQRATVAELSAAVNLIAVRQSRVSRTTPDFRIHVLTYNRHESLQRLLRALREADYEGDRIDLKISVDFPKTGDDDKHKKVVELAGSFLWPHGAKEVVVHTENQGLVRQWLNCWQPQSDDERGVILEDDLEPSVVYYKWLKKAWAKYGKMKEIFGISLQRQFTIPAGPRNQSRLAVVNGNNPFLYKLVGSWGYAPLAKPWREFQQWFQSRPADFFPGVDGVITTDWYKGLVAEGRANTMWTQWHIRFSDERDLYTLYANLAGDLTLCSNHMEPGEHFFKESPGVDYPRAPGWQPAMDNWPDKLELYDWKADVVGSVGPS